MIKRLLAPGKITYWKSRNILLDRDNQWMAAFAYNWWIHGHHHWLM